MYSSPNKLIIGTRGSDLALRQANIARGILLKKRPDLDIEIKVIKTTGDVKMTPIPESVVGKGWFTKEIEEELERETIDIAVHSLKDMALDLPPSLYIGAMLPREDARDALVSKSAFTLRELQSGAVVGTDSARREIQIRKIRPDIIVNSVRGNIVTRLSKLEKGDYDALVLALAGLRRLGLEKRATQIFSMDEVLPAPGQGILAVELKKGRRRIAELIGQITDESSEIAGMTERQFSRAIGGGCKKPVAAYAEVRGDGLTLEAMVCNAHGEIIRKKTAGRADQGEKLATELARELLDLSSKK